MNDCARKLVHHLAACGSWASKTELLAAVKFTEARVDDELADLVLHGTVLYNQRAREYKLAGTALARKALQQLLMQKEPRRILGAASPDKTKYHIGIATRTVGADGEELFSMAELEMPYPKGKPHELLLAAWAFGAELTAMAPQEGGTA